MSAVARAEQIAALARQFGAYLSAQTDVDIARIESIDGDDSGALSLTGAFDRLDAALAQIIDLASVYDDNRGDSIEPLALPVAALAGEYLRVSTNAIWLHPDDDDSRPDDALILVLPDGIAIDLLGVARATLLSGAPNLSAIAAGLAGVGDDNSLASGGSTS